MSELEEKRFYITSLYNEYLEKTENRNPSYGELLYIQDLSTKELDEFLEEILDELGADE